MHAPVRKVHAHSLIRKVCLYNTKRVVHCIDLLIYSDCRSIGTLEHVYALVQQILTARVLEVGAPVKKLSQLALHLIDF
jgi:hypothetical protein